MNFSKKEQQHRETGGDEDRDGFAEPSKRIVGSERFLAVPRLRSGMWDGIHRMERLAGTF